MFIDRYDYRKSVRIDDILALGKNFGISLNLDVIKKGDFQFQKFKVSI